MRTITRAATTTKATTQMMISVRVGIPLFEEPVDDDDNVEELIADATVEEAAADTREIEVTEDAFGLGFQFFSRFRGR
jgi:hypothetical protein